MQVIAEKQLNTISDLKSKLEDQTCRLAENNKVVDDLVNKVKTLSSELDSLKSSTNSIEQYGRRNSLRFTNMKLDVKTGESNLIDQMTDFINTKILKNEDSISVSDVERCHPVNCLKSDGRCQILIKFHNYHTKR